MSDLFDLKCEKQCSKCKENLSLDNFYLKMNLCKKCHNLRRKISRKKFIKQINDLKENNPCKDCGKIFPSYCMDWDHIGNDKFGDISKLVYRASKNTILNEIKKCELVCAICHRVRTHKRSQDRGKNE